MNIEYNSVYNLLKSGSENNFKKVAIHTNKDRYRYDDLIFLSNKIAAFLQLIGVKKGDRVGIYMENRWEYIVAVYAILAVGATVVPINFKIKSKELSFVLNDSNICYLFSSDNLRDIVYKSVAIHQCQNVIWVGSDTKGVRFDNILKQDLTPISVETDLEDEAFIFYTSGTEGKPKGAILTNKNILTSIFKAKEHINLTKKDKVILYLPLHHSFILLIFTITPLCFGSSITLTQYNGANELLKEIALKRVTILFAVPTIFNEIAKSELSWLFTTFNKLRLLVSGGSPISKDTIKMLIDKFDRAKFIEGYGLSESSGIVSANPIGKLKIGSVGLPIDGCQVKIVDSYDIELPTYSIGEIVVSGDNVMKGYVNNDNQNLCILKKGWLYTGDLGYLDDDGYLYIVDRKRDLIISKIAHIFPKEIEEIINRFDGVKESAVVGKLNKEGYEEPICFLVQSGEEYINIDNLKEYLKGFLAPYKIPQEYITVDKLPRNSGGKVLKKELKKNFN